MSDRVVSRGGIVNGVASNGSGEQLSRAHPEDRGRTPTHRGSVVCRADHRLRNGHHAFVVWLTGLSGSGKTTLARLLQEKLSERGDRCYLIDGDIIREGLCKDLGFTNPDRVENIRRVGEVARLFVDAGIVAIVALISPYAEARRRARRLFGPDAFVEVYVRCSIEICRQRDVKGLYKMTDAGVIRDMTGIGDIYEPPERPEVVVDTESQPAAVCITAILSSIKRVRRNSNTEANPATGTSSS